MKNYKPIFIFLVLTLLATAIMHISSETHVSTIYKCKVTNLQQQQLIKGKDGNMETEIRYLIVTDKGTFISESSIINKKFDNSEIFFNLQKDGTYNLKVCGYGKSFFFDYKNIIDYEKVSSNSLKNDNNPNNNIVTHN